jgi:hypothetical protein
MDRRPATKPSARPAAAGAARRRADGGRDRLRRQALSENSWLLAAGRKCPGSDGSRDEATQPNESLRSDNEYKFSGRYSAVKADGERMAGVKRELPNFARAGEGSSKVPRVVRRNRRGEHVQC